MYVLRNTDARVPNHSCKGRATNIYSECVCVCVALVIQHAMRMRHILICGLFGSTILFPHHLMNGTIFGEQLLNKTYMFFSTTFV